MSNKPLKISEQKRLNEKMKRRSKPVNTIILPEYTYIISEGTKTEPNYISGLANQVNTKYRNYSRGNFVRVIGTGRNTLSLLEFAREQVNIDFPQANIVWLMYDKDDFPKANFDNTQSSAEKRIDKRTFKVAWSNECIELWFLLHFQDLNSNIGRTEYTKKLELYIPYSKNDEKIYDTLKDKTDIAINRAKQQYKSYSNAPPTQCCPATRVFELVEELQKYL